MNKMKSYKTALKMLFFVGLIAILTIAFLSCGHGFIKDPRLYNPRKDISKSNQIVAEEPDLGLSGGIDPFDETDKWYNKVDSNGDDNSPEAVGFDAAEFDSIQITGWFSNENVPTYTMTKGSVWTTGDTIKKEYIHANAPNTEGQGWSISGVTYYQYRGINPGYAADGNYNTALQSTQSGNPKLSRFYFYRFTGKGGGVQWLDNNLIAVDTYSKLVFAFSEPVEFSSMGAPTKWSPTDLAPYIGQMYQFYQYDPVGYVLKKDNGYEIVLYKWFQDNLAKGNYKAKIDPNLHNLATKSPDGAGKSPFNNHTVDFFKENLKLLAGATFYRRESLADGSNGLVLYKYTVNSDATEITRTAESWNNLPTETSLETVVYNIDEKGSSATAGSLKTKDGKELQFSLSDESRTLSITGDGQEAEVAQRNFNDIGPSFRERIKGATYKHGNTAYEFSQDGNTLTWTWDGGKKTYQWDGSVTDTEYTTYGGYRIRLYENDFQIKGATLPNVGAVSIMEYLAYRYTKQGDTFKESVKGKTFSYRKKNENGYDTSLMTLQFNADGSSATLYETIWGKIQSDTVKSTLNVEDGSNATDGKLNNQQVTLTFPENSQWFLTYESDVYTLGYADPGPSFVNRVKDCPIFVSSDGKTTYRFSNFGKNLRMTYTGASTIAALFGGNFDYTYEYIQQVDTETSSTSRAVYKATNGIAGFSFAGFELSNSDMEIKATNTSAASGSLVDWLVVTYAAQRNGDTGMIPTEEEMQGFYDSLKSKKFSTRNTENEVAGLELLTWEFGTDGRSGTLKKKIWLSEEETTEVTIPLGQVVAQSKTSGTFLAEDKSRYNFAYDETSSSLMVSTVSQKQGTTSLTYYANYDDKGPGFVNRVKGKTYVQAGKTKDNGYSYTFSADGTICTYKNPNANIFQTKSATYNYEPNNDKGTSGKYVYAVYGGFFVDLCDGNDGRKDSVFRMENTKAASDYWAADMEWEAILLP